MPLMFDRPRTPSGRLLPPRDAGGRFRVRSGKGGSLYWYGEEVAAVVEAAAVAAVREVAHRCVDHAEANHPWKNRTGATEASGHVQEPIVEAGRVKVRWGFASPALFLELGTYRTPAFPFMRPAQDLFYPEIAPLMASLI